MKTKFFKLVMPMVALMLAIGGAFAFNTVAMENDAFAPEIGYVDTEQPCSIEVECDTDGTIVCRDSNGLQAFGDDGQENCEKVLYRQQ